MKKTTLLLSLILIIAMVFVGCNTPNPDESFTIVVSNITDRHVSVKITPSDNKTYYNWDIKSADWYEEHKDSIGEYYKAKWDDWYEDGSYSRYDEFGNKINSAEDLYYKLMYKGTTNYPNFDLIRPSTDYVAFAYYHEPDFHAKRIATFSFRSPKAEIMKDMIVQFYTSPANNPQKVVICLNNDTGDSLFYGSISTKELGAVLITEYAEQLFDECMTKGGELKDAHNSWTGGTKQPYPEEPTEWFGCSFYGNARTSNWFFYHTPK